LCKAEEETGSAGGQPASNKLYGYTVSGRGAMPLLFIRDTGTLVWLRKPNHTLLKCPYNKIYSTNYKNKPLYIKKQPSINRPFKSRAAIPSFNS
jgi:hypothetical protein